MKKILLIISLATVVLFTVSAIAAESVVVVPLGGVVGDATAADVVKGKTFSSKAGKGLTGTLDLKVGEIYTNSIGMEFRLISAGYFFMGSPDGTGMPVAWTKELGRSTSETQHVVTLTTPFYMQTTEVTQGQWQRVMASNPSYFTNCGSDCPVEQVSWDDAQLFIAALNAGEGRTNCDTNPNTCYFLPTEAQWEYAARAGTSTAFYSGDITYTDCSVDPNLDAIGWYCGNSDITTHPVAQKASNNWGLYDMSGNVYEWCADWYGTYPAGPLTDPTGPVTGTYHTVRGASFNVGAVNARSANRNYNTADYRVNRLGFRLALSSGK